MHRVKLAVKVISLLLLVFVVLSPVVQHYFPRGVMVSRADLSGWSYGLGQIAFGLVAAFLVFLLPQVVDVSRFLLRWDQMSLYYRKTPTFDREAALAGLRRTLSGCANPTGYSLPAPVKSWIQNPPKSSSGAQLTETQLDMVTAMIARELHELIMSEEKWSLMLEHGNCGAPPWQATELRCLLVATHSSSTLRRKRTKLALLLSALIAISLLFGTSALAPDPFLYVYLTRLVSGRFALPDEYFYPEMALWLTACAYLVEIFFLALWFGLENFSVQNPDKFERKTL